MSIDRIIELLEIEKQCVLRNTLRECDRDCANCDLVQRDSDLLKMYTAVIDLLKERQEEQ